MRRRHRALVVSAVLAIVVISCALFNLERMRAYYWAERAESCGVLSFGVRGLMTTSDEAQRGVDCFTQAASHCRSVELRADVTNTDSGTTYWFLVEAPLSPLGACEIAALWTANSIHAVGGGAAACQAITRLPTGLRFTGCGAQGDIILPTTHGSSIQ